MALEIPVRVRLAYGSLAYTGQIADDDARLARAVAFVRAQPEAWQHGVLTDDTARAWALTLMQMQGHPHRGGAPKSNPSPSRGSAKRQGTRPPSHDAVMLWSNFVLFAVVGMTSAADQIMEKHRALVLEMATWMQRQRPVAKRELYRGVLVEPEVLIGGQLAADPRVQFLSWTEELQVACWFADRDSIISECVREKKPRVRGYIATDTPRSADVLWHHEWMDIPVSAGPGNLNLAIFAAHHPHVDDGQFLWNVETQREVITLPPAAGMIKVVPRDELDCDETDELDARFTYPLYLAQRLRF